MPIAGSGGSVGGGRSSAGGIAGSPTAGSSVGGALAGGGRGGSPSAGSPSAGSPSAGSSSAGSSSGGSTSGAGGAPAGGASSGSGGGAAAAAGGADPSLDGSLGKGAYVGSGTSSEQFYTAADIQRNGQSYVLITNGWGPNFKSHTISWNGTSFTVEAMQGGSGSNGQPASYPSVFCGQYSVMERGSCGLPKALNEITSLRTGWRWAPNGNENGKYNAAYDIWVGDATRFRGYYMVWLRDPPGYQPAGSANSSHRGVTVANAPGTWDVWNGTVNNLPIVNWVRREGADSHEIEFDVMDFIRDAEMRGLAIPNVTHMRAVAVGFEIWEGPIMGLKSLDFYVDVK